jgi:hypothetical protein
MTPNELANLKIARKWLDLSTGRESALDLIDGLIRDAEKEHAKNAAAYDAMKAIAPLLEDPHGEGR